MLDNPSLAAALERRAAADPESPFLFWSRAWRWEWRSWQQAAVLTARWARDLAALPAGARVGFAGDQYPEAMLLDLAVQAAGLTPVPVGVRPWPGEAGVEAAVRGAGCVAWVDGEVDGDVRVSRLAADGAAEEMSREAAAGKGGEVWVRGAAGAWRAVRSGEVMAAAERVGQLVGVGAGLAAGKGKRKGKAKERRNGAREIVVLGRSLGDEVGRLVAAWAVAAGAAVVAVEPEATIGTVAAAVWARPTVFCGGEGEVAALRREIEGRPRRGGGGRWMGRTWGGQGVGSAARRLPLGRLRVVLQAEPPAAPEVAYWGGRGTRLERLPELGGGGL